MSCVKCSNIPKIEAKPARIYFVGEVDELEAKLKQFFLNLGIDLKEDNGAYFIDVENAFNFFEQHLDKFKENFPELLADAIHVVIYYNNEKFNFKSLLCAKSLQYYINSFEDREFFYILENASFTFYFQPIVNVNDKSIYGYEALVRGIKSDGSIMFPDELFKKSKRNDLDFSLDKLCRENALKAAAAKNIKQKVFINFLPTAIYDPAFCLKTTIEWAHQLEFDPKNIVFEVVETESVEDKKHLLYILEYYKKEGFMVALDDVGEGYSGLIMLIEIKPDIIKVDRKIIQNIDSNKLKQSTYKALYNLAKEHDILVLAEGVETANEFATIREIGVDLAQGYYFAKPQPEPIRSINFD